MANIKIELDYPLEDGVTLTFKAPCDCTAVTGVKVYYPEITETASTIVSKIFTLKDTHLNDLAGLGNLFMSGSTVKIVVDVTNEYAFVQNADTNSYLESVLNNCCKIATGSYVGNGEDGNITLSFGFTPKAFQIISHTTDTNFVYIPSPALQGGDMSVTSMVKSSAIGGCRTIPITWTGNSLSWTAYKNNNGSTLNQNGVTYEYIAFG